MAKKVKKPKPAKKTAKPKKASAKKPAVQRRERMAANQINEEDKALFLHHMPLIAAGRDAITKATNKLRTLYKTAKSDGFVKLDFDDAFQMQGADGQKKAKAAIARRLTIARYLGLELGQSLDLFLDTEAGKEETENRSFETGKQHAMEGKTADATGFDEQEYLKGYHSVTEQRVKGGIKPTEPSPPKGARKVSPEVAEAADRAQKAAEKARNAAQRKSWEPDPVELLEDDEAFEAPTSGQPMTRAQYAAQQEAQRKAGDPAAAGSGLFQKKTDAPQPAAAE